MSGIKNFVNGVEKIHEKLQLFYVLNNHHGLRISRIAKTFGDRKLVLVGWY